MGQGRSEGKKGCTNKKKESASEINDYLNSLSTTIGDIFKGYEVEEVSPTIARVREDFNARMAGATPEAGQTSAKRFQEVWDAFIEEESRSKDWTVATHRKYNAVRNRLKDFKTTLSFDDMEEKTLNKWVEFLQKQPIYISQEEMISKRQRDRKGLKKYETCSFSAAFPV